MYAVSAFSNNTKQQCTTDRASVLCHAHGHLETGPQFDVGLQLVDSVVIPVDRYLAHSAIGATLVDEVGHPRKTVGTRRGTRAAKYKTCFGKRPKVVVPKRNSRVNIKVGLADFVDPIEGGSAQGN